MHKLYFSFSPKSNLQAAAGVCFTACHMLKARNSILFTPLAYLPVYLIAADFENIKNCYHTWSNLHLLSLSRCVSAELSPSLCDCTAWWEFWSASQKGSDSLILLSSLNIYKSKIYLCFLFPEFCSVNFHMLQYFFWACVSVSLCVSELEKPWCLALCFNFHGNRLRESAQNEMGISEAPAHTSRNLPNGLLVHNMHAYTHIHTQTSWTASFRLCQATIYCVMQDGNIRVSVNS